MTLRKAKRDISNLKKEINRRYNIDNDSDFNIFNHIDGIVEFIRYCGFSDSNEIYEIICGLDAFSDTDKTKLYNKVVANG